ncbi:pyridoxamine kinase [Abyssisolibacter fermentans]|uniref:pyridoxamine kinase n=1 Tax=Abyssisolibacter fermentans TaxID=1766203 RepID=UPI0008295999|nr:pyridoxamine kinase [Abyssisolibacter fermentans]
MNQVKRVAAIHDLAGFGRASLSVIIPIISTMGMQVCPMPTAVLSSHTEFDNYTFVDLTDTMENYMNHWKDEKIEFDSIYSGFLGSPKQIGIISKFIDTFKTDKCLVVVDPVMGDNGQLYSTMDMVMVENMRKLIQKADIITPNFTEAAYLLGEEYNRDISEEKVKEWLKRLADMGAKTVIITSVPTESTKNTAVIAYDSKEDKYWKVSCQYIPAHFPGTGDAFTSVIVGSLLKGDSLPMALDRGVQFITACIRASYGFNYPRKEGVLLEKVLGNLNMPFMISSYELLE